MRLLVTVWVVTLFLGGGVAGGRVPEKKLRSDLLSAGKRIVFVGDSNTFAGRFLYYIESEVRRRADRARVELINLGLPSETVSGLSEPDHPFPRPDLHERLDRVLEKSAPDVVFACYGMNDGVYYPFSKKHFKAYRDGVNELIAKVKKQGARLALMTPPPFDPLPMRRKGKLRPRGAKKFAWFGIYEKYDTEVLARYSEWILQQKDRVDLVIDIRTPLLKYTAKRRTQNPEFVMSGDGVHFNDVGHRVVAEAILSACGFGTVVWPEPKALELIQVRQDLLRDAWLSHVGHRRPGMKKGLPFRKALEKAKELDRQIRQH